MAQITIIEKVEVRNPLSSLTTVGQELAGIFIDHNIDVTRLGIKNLCAKESLTDRQLEKARALLDLSDVFVQAMKDFQTEYSEQKIACKESFKKSKAYYKKLKTIIPLLGKDFNDGFDRLDDIVNYFGVDSEESIFEQVHATGCLYREQNQAPIDDVNLCGWLRRGELDFQKVKDSLPAYNKEGLLNWIDERSWSDKIAKVSYFKQLPDILKDFGVCVVLIPYLQKTVYGAVKWIEGHPVVMISDRNQDLASCWFTLFHELGHVILHEDLQTSIDGEINTTKGASLKREKEANKFANKYLFNGDELRKHIFELKRQNNFESQDDIAKRYNVDILFVGYWMHKAQYYPAQHIHQPIVFSCKY